MAIVLTYRLYGEGITNTYELTVKQEAEHEIL